ncbi:UDP-galactose-4-epimerase [Georgfuchsia toluolica]|uniref:UDP-glucose 4-epimerase n=1 Tax=Georgfuchsia toluolica TaxID=424218 RepID=A0A916J5H4_9PROT|nr:UDP-glucose 4-epimerase GalE [Georgfuchsia toluolica]CAG4884373.1 UDP-galactose-4-epimerase [Georgfuchsia toluolica]
MILVTGGTGYIGSHTCVALAKAGHELLILDNLCNSQADVVDRLETLCGKRPAFIQGDVRDSQLLGDLFDRHPISAVMHFAGLKAVGESVAKPLEYYDNNVHGTLQLLAAMRRAQVKTFVFSSSATVYGDPASVPIREDFPRSATNPYGRSKLIIEDILADLHRAEPDWRMARLRYFNPVGAHESGLIGEDPQGIPNNLMPFVAQVAVGKREFLNVWGNDYPTPDGTGIRDYIHVVDLAEGHVAALDYLKRKGGLLTVNLGTGRGYSVLDMVKAFEIASGRSIPYQIASRRAGDIAQCWADPSLAREMLNWKAERGLDQMCADVWRWQQGSRSAHP